LPHRSFTKWTTRHQFQGTIWEYGSQRLAAQRLSIAIEDSLLREKVVKTSMWVFLIAFALVFYGTGASFIESFAVYPAMRFIGPNEFAAWHESLTPPVLGFLVLPVLAGTLFSILLLWFRPLRIPLWAVWLVIGLQAILWLSSITIQIPLQFQLRREGPLLPLIERLIITNWWLRRVPYIATAFLFFWMMTRLLRPATSEP
jgi:hypothetical protein